MSGAAAGSPVTAAARFPKRSSGVDIQADLLADGEQVLRIIHLSTSATPPASVIASRKGMAQRCSSTATAAVMPSGIASAMYQTS